MTVVGLDNSDELLETLQHFETLFDDFIFHFNNLKERHGSLDAKLHSLIFTYFNFHFLLSINHIPK